jgi:hypothetical protein
LPSVVPAKLLNQFIRSLLLFGIDRQCVRQTSKTWSLRRIEQATGVRRETASAYIKTAGIKVRQPGWERANRP